MPPFTTISYSQESKHLLWSSSSQAYLPFWAMNLLKHKPEHITAQNPETSHLTQSTCQVLYYAPQSPTNNPTPWPLLVPQLSHLFLLLQPTGLLTVLATWRHPPTTGCLQLPFPFWNVLPSDMCMLCCFISFSFLLEKSFSQSNLSWLICLKFQHSHPPSPTILNSWHFIILFPALFCTLNSYSNLVCILPLPTTVDC